MERQRTEMNMHSDERIVMRRPTMKTLVFAIFLFTSIAASPANKKAVQNSATPSKRIYIEPYFFTPGAVASSTGNVAVAAGLPARNLALEATKGFVKSCPLVAATDNREAADYVLKISPGSSVLYKQNGDVAYISPAKRRVSNLVKDVCNYVVEGSLSEDKHAQR